MEMVAFCGPGQGTRTPLLLLVLISLLGCCTQCTAAPVANDPSEDSDHYLHTLSWETYWVGSGRIETEHATVHLPRDAVHQANEYIHSRHKRMIFGEDDRLKINPAVDGTKFPHTAVVRVSSGCSGTLISEKHVLTSAHCVHDGEAYLQSALFFLRAGYIDPDGDTRWYFVRRFFVPSQWKNLTSNGAHQYSDWEDYDVAVLEMNEDLGRERAFMPPGLSGLFCDNKKSVHGASSRVEYCSFPDDKTRDAMWYEQTEITTESPHLLYFTGDAWHGSSGAGLYTWDYSKETKKYEKRVIAVLSGNRNTVPFARVQGNFNVAARLTATNLMMVCHWIGTESECKDRYREYFNKANRETLCKP